MTKYLMDDVIGALQFARSAFPDGTISKEDLELVLEGCEAEE